MRSLLLPICCSLAVAVAAQGEPYHRYYNDEQRPLTLDVERFAVLGTAKDLDLAALPIDGWSLAAVPADKRTAAKIEDLVAGIAVGPDVDFVSPVFVGDDGGPVIITPDILVGFHRHIPAEQAAAILAASDAGVVTDVDWAGMKRAYRIRSLSHNGFDVLAAANALAQLPQVKFAEPDMIFTGHAADVYPDDPGFLNTWGLHNVGLYPDCDMDAPQAWDITTGDPSIIVVVIDTGVQQDHPDINQIPGTDTTSQAGDSGPVNECESHGTWVAGCVSARLNNGLGTVGIAPGVKSASARTFISNLPCDGSWTSQGSWTVDSLEWAETNGARVTNNSNIYGFTSAAIEQKYFDTRANGMVHFAAAGNDSSSKIGYPASIDWVNAVAALNYDCQLAGFSNYGEGLAFSAPGRRIYTTDRTGLDGGNAGDYLWVGGTSFASPYSAGVAALILSVNDTLTADQVETQMQQTATDLGIGGYDTLYGWGMVNACAAVGGNCAETCGAGAGTCGEPHGGFGCDDAGCCTYVCTIDPDCCNVMWDEACATFATDLCGGADSTGVTELASVDSDGNQGENSSGWTRLAADAPHLVALDSAAENLDPADANGFVDVFLHDFTTGDTSIVSLNTDGTQGNANSFLCEISDDGRWIVFQSFASSLVVSDTNGAWDTFVRDTQTDETVRVSVSSAGIEGNNTSTFASITPDGRFVVFQSGASNLVPDDTNFVFDIFVHDRDTDEDGVYDEPGEILTERVSVGPLGVQGDLRSIDNVCPQISDDGRYVVFSSDATNLVLGDTNGARDVFVRDRDTGRTVRVSVSSAGAQGNSASQWSDISPDGRYVVYRSAAANLVPDDTNATYDAFFHDRDADADGIFDEPGGILTERVSLSSTEVQNNGGVGVVSVSDDGRFVAFNSSGSTLAPPDFNFWDDVFLRDRIEGTTTLLSIGNSPGDDYSRYPNLSSDGRYVAFQALATNLVENDVNGYRDSFRRDLGEVGAPCPWDLDGDDIVGIIDFLGLLAAWGSNPVGPPDFDGGGVGITDFLALLANWGPCP